MIHGWQVESIVVWSVEGYGRCVEVYPMRPFAIKFVDNFQKVCGSFYK